ncbi:MAG TPA: 2,4-dihydroxyhept-2-ene-1,7-dioic acid aldolase [Candidatus Choladousia intestinigallinarum]|nr:2,4-dihydroxyhept-2-ene-1,7-dioic acid aldolase [Candidatus Choladousia intestinigallinarum]
MSLKDIMRERKAGGVLIKIVGHPAAVLIAKNVGMDFVFYDCEHGSLSYEKLHDLMVLGNQIGLPSVVRVPQLARGDVSKILDYGAQGVMVPMIESAEDARKLVEWSKYPPVGKRSYSGGANTNYGPSGGHAANMLNMNQRTLTIAQIETAEGVNCADEILSVEGIDAAIVGPCDLGISMGIPDNVMDVRELSAIEKVAEACRRHGKFFGIIGSMELMKYFKKDLDIIITAIDTNLLRAGMAASAEECRRLNEK